MKKEEIKFKYWETGEERSYPLSSSHPAENPSGLICPFDNTEIIRWHDQASFKGYNCPNCGLEYSLQFGNQESVNEFFNKHLKNLEKRLKKLKEEKREINLVFKHAEKQGLDWKK